MKISLIMSRVISFLGAPSAFSIDYGQSILGQNYPLGFVPGALDYDHRKFLIYELGKFLEIL